MQEQHHRKPVFMPSYGSTLSASFFILVNGTKDRHHRFPEPKALIRKRAY